MTANQTSGSGGPGSNEAAERLRTYMRQLGAGSPLPLLGDALAAERRATVERIRERFTEAYGIVGRPDLAWIDAILDKEAAR